jgi:hypothetical protein
MSASDDSPAKQTQPDCANACAPKPTSSSWRVPEFFLGLLCATALWALGTMFYFHPAFTIRYVEFSDLELYFQIATIGFGMALVTLIIYLRRKIAESKQKSNAPEAVGILGAAIIGASVAFLVGHSTDENTRTVGINSILAQVETVIDTHQAAKPCAKYALEADLAVSLANNDPPGQLPERKSKALCLSKFMMSLGQNASDPRSTIKSAAVDARAAEDLMFAQFLFIREQVFSVLNVLELAADYSTGDHPLSHGEAEYVDRTLSGQKMLARYLDGMTAQETKDMLFKLMPGVKVLFGTSDPDKFWRICRALKCVESPPGTYSHDDVVR